MILKCGWCGADLGIKPGPEGMVSHGMCKPCSERVLGALKLARENAGQRGRVVQNPAEVAVRQGGV